MIQVAIFLVLVVIAIILAPWLIGVIAIAAAAYGVWVVAIGVAVAIGGIIGVAWSFASVMGRKDIGEDTPPIIGDRVACPHCQAEVSAQLSNCDNCRQPLR